MSKAFTREDDKPESEPPKRLPSVLPEGAINYVTPNGAKRLRAELDALLGRVPPDLTKQAASERIVELRRILGSAVILGPPTGDLDVVHFGASVTVRRLPGEETVRYRIVGVDETDITRGWISWVSPIATALLSACVGDRVRATLPSGEKDLEILDVTYE